MRLRGGADFIEWTRRCSNKIIGKTPSCPRGISLLLRTLLKPVQSYKLLQQKLLHLGALDSTNRSKVVPKVRGVRRSNLGEKSAGMIHRRERPIGALSKPWPQTLFDEYCARVCRITRYSLRRKRSPDLTPACEVDDFGHERPDLSSLLQWQPLCPFIGATVLGKTSLGNEAKAIGVIRQGTVRARGECVDSRSTFFFF